MLRLLELKHPVAFENGEFFALYQAKALAPDLVTSEELELRPGESRELKLSVQDGSRYVGVLAAYRDLPEASWRYVIAVPPQERTRIAPEPGRARHRAVRPARRRRKISMSLHRLSGRKACCCVRSTSSKAIDTTITNSRRAPRS